VSMIMSVAMTMTVSMLMMVVSSHLSESVMICLPLQPVIHGQACHSI
jgi:hypothetical protein